MKVGFIGLGIMGRPMAGHLRAEEWRGTVSAGFMVLDAAEP